MYPTKKLWEVCEIITWSTPKTSNLDFFWWDILWAWPADIWEEKYILKTNKTLTDKWLFDGKARLVKKWSVLLVAIGTIWKVSIAGSDLTTNQQIHALQTEKNIIPEFLYYYLLSNKEKLKNQASSAVLAILNKSRLSNFLIPLPPLSTQKLIVDKLDMIFVEIEKSKNLLEKNLQNMDEMNKSVLEKVFANDEWERKKLGEVCENKKLDVWNVKTQNYLHKWKFPIIDQWKKFISWYSNDEGLVFQGNFPVLIYWDHTNIVKYIDFPFITWADGIKILYFSNKIDTKFIYYAILCLKPKNHWYRRHFPLLKQISIPLPPLSKQKEIVSYLDSVFAENQKLQNLYQAQIKNLDEMKQSFLKKAFAGELI